MEKVTRAQMSLIRSLATAKGRRETGLFVAEGPKLVKELTDGGLQLELIVKSGENIAPSDFERISTLKSPQGIIAVFHIPHYEMPQVDGNTLIIALDGVQDPGNMGTILRLADWFGVEDVVCSQDCASAWQPKVVQASMGALARVRVHRLDVSNQAAYNNTAINNLSAWLKCLPQGTPIYGTFLDGESVYNANLPQGGVIIMGNEGNGISEEVARTVTHRLLIPNYPIGRTCVESLNVATATAIILSHIRAAQCKS